MGKTLLNCTQHSLTRLDGARTNTKMTQICQSTGITWLEVENVSCEVVRVEDVYSIYI